ncbi:MAG TPA: class II aldolase/adducin family protein [Chloroflexi bacterium]|nr:class II aldolase/adducin family protein [Chloroflexota bacterium]
MDEVHATNMEMNERALRRDVGQICRLLYQKNFVPATDGNVSVRWGDRYLITTPSGVCKGLIRAADLVVTDLNGAPVLEHNDAANPRRPSSELRMHLEIYRRRPDVRAVVHAHPAITTALTVAGVSLLPCILPETLVNLGSIATTAYATPTTEAVPVVVGDLIEDHDALVLDRHGAVTVGATLMEAYTRMEKVEDTAQVIMTARMLGRVQTLPIDEVRRLGAKRDALLGPERHFAGPDCAQCGACEGLPEIDRGQRR